MGRFVGDRDQPMATEVGVLSSADSECALPLRARSLCTPGEWVKPETRWRSAVKRAVALPPVRLIRNRSLPESEVQGRGAPNA